MKIALEKTICKQIFSIQAQGQAEETYSSIQAIQNINMVFFVTE